MCNRRGSSARRHSPVSVRPSSTMNISLIARSSIAQIYPLFSMSQSGHPGRSSYCQARPRVSIGGQADAPQMPSPVGGAVITQKMDTDGVAPPFGRGGDLVVLPSWHYDVEVVA